MDAAHRKGIVDFSVRATRKKGAKNRFSITNDDDDDDHDDHDDVTFDAEFSDSGDRYGIWKNDHFQITSGCVRPFVLHQL